MPNAQYTRHNARTCNQFKFDFWCGFHKLIVIINGLVDNGYASYTLADEELIVLVAIWPSYIVEDPLSITTLLLIFTFFTSSKILMNRNTYRYFNPFDGWISKRFQTDIGFRPMVSIWISIYFVFLFDLMASKPKIM